MEDLKIFSYLDKLIDAYKEPIQIMDGLPHDFKETIRTIEFYANDLYLSGNRDELLREKPFHNIGNFRKTVAKTATDVDVKDLKYTPESLNDSVPTMIINKELFKYLKESNFSETLNDMGETRPKYGGLLVKKYKYLENLEIQVVEWKNVDVDPCDIPGGIIIETHWLWPSELYEKDSWDQDKVKEFLKVHSKANKGKPVRLEVKEMSGEFAYSYDPELDENEENDTKYKRMCFYIGVVNKKKFLLYYEEEKESKYKYLAWEKIPGRSLGRGVIEEGFEAQVWTNDAIIAIKNAMGLAGKVILSTDSNKVSGNALVGVDNGHIFNLEPGRTINSLNLAPSKFPELYNIIDLWNRQYNNSVSVHDANTGNRPPSGTPYSQTALLNQVANSPFEYQREVWGIFLNELLNDWIFPHVKRRILKNHDLVAEYDADELKIIDDAIKTFRGNDSIKDIVLNQGGQPTELDRMEAEMGVEKEMSYMGNKRELNIPEKFLDIKGRITANITGELKDKQAILQSLASIGADITRTFNPNTGRYAALEDPTLSKIYGTIIEMSGVPLSHAQLKPKSIPSPMTPALPAAPVA